MIIYIATNKTTGKFYIGQTTKTLDERRKMHEWLALSAKRKTYFHRALRKYGVDNFQWSVYKRVKSKAKLDKEEKRLIALYNKETIYNLSSGGEGAVGYKRSAKTRARDRAIALARPPCSEATRIKMSLSGLVRGKRDTKYHSNILRFTYKVAKVKYGISKTHYYRLRKVKYGRLKTRHG